jgi:hypothetical protein
MPEWISMHDLLLPLHGQALRQHDRDTAAQYSAEQP